MLTTKRGLWIFVIVKALAIVTFVIESRGLSTNDTTSNAAHAAPAFPNR